MKFSTECPYCGIEISWGNPPSLRQRVSCFACKGQSIVNTVDPIELDEIFWDAPEKPESRNKKRYRAGKSSYMEYVEDDDPAQKSPFRRYKGNRPSRKKQSDLSWA